MIKIFELSAGRLSQAKWAYTTRRIDQSQVTSLLTGDIVPDAGDLVLARVDKTDHHSKLELTTSRKASMFEGDEIVVVFGNRYAPDQFEGIVPDFLEPCRLVAAGGVAARILNRHNRMKRPTRITPLGLLGDSQGTRINLRSFRLSRTRISESAPLFLAVAGSSMNSGKTTACANLVKGMVRCRLKVAAAKVTGTGAGADYRMLIDAGADPVYDFLDAGYVSTYRLGNEELRDITLTLCGDLASSKADIVVIEVADGLLQRETARLCVMPEFSRLIDGVIFASNDSLGAQSGVSWLTARKLPVIGSTGVLTSSPLDIREAEQVTGFPVFETDSLRRSNVAGLLFDCLQSRRHQKKAIEQSDPDNSSTGQSAVNP